MGRVSPLTRKFVTPYILLESSTLPKPLTSSYPCMHVTCLDCAKGWIKAQTSNYKKEVRRTGNVELDPRPWYTCPICRELTGVLLEPLPVPCLMAVGERAVSFQT